MDKKLFVQALVKFFSGLLLSSALIFIPAGTTDYFGGRLFTAALFVPMFIAGIVMMLKAPELLRKRLEMRERQGEQKAVIALSGAMFTARFVCAGLSFRFGVLTLPRAAQIAAAFVFLLGYALFAEVLRENAYLSRTVEVQEDQKLVDTGLYGAVRHPMYSSTLLLFLSMPLILGSLISFLISLCYLPIIRKRILNEEKGLEEGLPGYVDYEKRVRWRLLPGVW